MPPSFVIYSRNEEKTSFRSHFIGSREVFFLFQNPSEAIHFWQNKMKNFSPAAEQMRHMHVNAEERQQHKVRSERKIIDEANDTFHIHKWIESATNYSRILCHLRAAHTRFSSSKWTNSIPRRINLICPKAPSHHRRREFDMMSAQLHTRAAGMPMGIALLPSDGHTFIIITTTNRFNSERSPRLGNNAQTNLCGQWGNLPAEVCVAT